MKNSINCVYLSFLLIGLLFSSSSCNKEDISARDNFLGSFSTVETCGSGNDAYNLTIIESGSDEKAVVVINLYNYGQQLNATVSGNSITIPSQLANGITYSGKGTISDNTLTLNYTLSAASGSDNCNATCTR